MPNMIGAYIRQGTPGAYWYRVGFFATVQDAQRYLNSIVQAHWERGNGMHQQRIVDGTIFPLPEKFRGEIPS